MKRWKINKEKGEERKREKKRIGKTKREKVLTIEKKNYKTQFRLELTRILKIEYKWNTNGTTGSIFAEISRKYASLFARDKENPPEVCLKGKFLKE